MTTLTSCIGEETDQSTYLGSAIEPKQPQTQARASSPPQKQTLCPFCGEFNLGSDKPCEHCNQLDTSASRAAATQRSGLWFVHQATDSNPKGMSFDELRSLIHQQVVTPRSIVRGPGTGQLYRLASTIRGLGREFGQCFSCGGDVDSNESICPHCDRVQTVQEFPEENPQPMVGEAFATPKPDSEAPPSAGSSAEKPGSSEYLRDRRQPDMIEEEEPLIPELAGAAREALLGEPTIRIHSMSDHEVVAEEDEDFYVRPVIAERTERHIPKDDLLTPSELAKAFQLEYGMNQNDIDRPYRIPGKTTRQVKIVLAGTGALAIAFVLGMQAIRMLDQTPVRPHTPALASATPAVVPVQPTHTTTQNPDAQLASVAFAPPAPLVKTFDKPAEKPTVSAVPPAPIPAVAPVPTPAPVSAPVKPPVAVVIPAPQPAPHSAPAPKVSPVIYVEPTPVQTSEDDPNILMNTGLTAESNGNYTAAINAYERLQSLPSSEWPPTLKTRLELARKELKGELH